jgi:hypothetical protein
MKALLAALALCSLSGCAGVRLYETDKTGTHKVFETTANGPYAFRDSRVILSGTADCSTATAAQGSAAIQVLQGSATLVGGIGAAVATSGVVPKP